MTWYVIDPDKKFVGIALATADDDGIIDVADGYHHPIHFFKYRENEKKPKLVLIPEDEFEKLVKDYENEIESAKAFLRSIDVFKKVDIVQEGEFNNKWAVSFRRVQGPGVNFCFVEISSKMWAIYCKVENSYYKLITKGQPKSELVAKYIINHHYEQQLP